MFNNVCDYSHELLMKHYEFMDNVVKKKTPFRNLEHARTVMLSDMKINYLPEEEAFRQTLLEI